MKSKTHETIRGDRGDSLLDVSGGRGWERTRNNQISIDEAYQLLLRCDVHSGCAMQHK